jgi:hypothetical protein
MFDVFAGFLLGIVAVNIGDVLFMYLVGRRRRRDGPTRDR